MGRISKRKLHEDLEARIYEIFLEHIASLQTPLEVKEFLRSLLSHTEQVMLAKRLAIAVLLSRGYTYQQIDTTLKVSKATVAIVHRELLLGAPGYDKAIQSAKRRKQKEKLWNSLEELLLTVSLPARVGSARHRLKSHIGKELFKRKQQTDMI